MSKARIKEITPATAGPEIHVPIINKWIPNNKRAELCYLFVDANGDAIEAVANSAHQRHYDSILQVKSCYAISRYISIEARNKMAVVPHKASIKIGKRAIIKPIEDANIPMYYFNFIPYDSLENHIADPKPLADFIGRVESISDILVKNDIQRRKVTIQDPRKNFINITLWTTKVNDIQKPDDVGKLIAVTSMLVTRYTDIQLESTSATTININPPLRNLEEYKNRFKDMGPPATTSNQNSITTLTELLSRKPEHNMPIKGTCVATMTVIDLERPWYYVRCNKCNDIAYPVTTDHFFHECADHGQDFGIKYMYCVNALITDEHTSAKAVFFDEAMTEMVNTTCRDMVLKKGCKDPMTIPIDISSIRGKPHLLQLTVNNKGNIYVNSAQQQTQITPLTPNPKTINPRRELEQKPEKESSSKKMKM